MGINFKFSRNFGSSIKSNQISEDRSNLRRNVSDQLPVSFSRGAHSGQSFIPTNSDFLNLPLPNQIVASPISSERRNAPITASIPETRINFRNPRSSGGRFYSNRIDEGRSGIRYDIGYISGANPIPEPTFQSLNIWEWNFNDTNLSNSLDGPFYLGNISNGTGTVSASFNEFATQGTLLRVNPRIEIGYSPQFGSHLSGVALYRLKTPALDKRFRIQIRYNVRDATGGVRTPNFGILINATKIDSQAEIANLYGSMIWITNGGIKTHNVQSGAMGPAFVRTPTWTFATAGATNDFVRFSVEMKDVVGDRNSGSIYRAYMMRRDDGLEYGAHNIMSWMSQTYSPWTSDGTPSGTPISGCNNVYLVIGAISGGAGSDDRKFNIEELAIMYHELDLE